MTNNTLEFHSKWVAFYTEHYPIGTDLILTYEDVENINFIGSAKLSTVKYLANLDNFIENDLIWC